MFAKVFVPMFFGAVYSSGWWAFAIWSFGEYRRFVMTSLILFGIGYIFLLAAMAVEDFKEE